MNILGWFTDPANWTGPGGIPAKIGYHLVYSAIALLAALAIAVPLGIVIGYTGRGEALIAGLANALRALPSLGLLVLLFLIISQIVTGKTVYVLPTSSCWSSWPFHRFSPEHTPAFRAPIRTRWSGPRHGVHQASDPVARPASVCVAPVDLRGQKLDAADHFDRHHRCVPRTSGARPVHSRWPCDGELQRNGRWCSSRRDPRHRARSALPGWAGSSSRPGCGAPRPSPPHQSPRPSPRRPPLRCRPAPTNREPHHEKHHEEGQSAQPWPSRRYSRCPHVVVAAVTRSREAGTTADPRVRKSLSVPPISPRASSSEPSTPRPCRPKAWKSRNSSTSEAERSTSRPSRTGRSIWFRSIPVRY